VARLDQKKKQSKTAKDAGDAEVSKKKMSARGRRVLAATDIPGNGSKKLPESASKNQTSKSSASSASSAVVVSGPVKRPMPTTIHPMLAESVEKPFDDPDWLFEIKWDGY